MKKGLSVLLIVAALFGFYGGASSLTDVLACKDYWEKEGEKSTADMNKLEDGLNQLGENEQAYLDGVQQLAEGEQTLAAAEQAYAEAPAKLRAAEAAIADGEGKLDDLATLLDGIKQVHAGYVTMSAYETLRDGRDATVAALQKEGSDTQVASANLLKLMGALGYGDPETGATPDATQAADAKTAAASLKTAGAILTDPSKQKAGSHTDEQYATFDEAMDSQITGLATASTVIGNISGDLSTANDNLPSTEKEVEKIPTIMAGLQGIGAHSTAVGAMLSPKEAGDFAYLMMTAKSWGANTMKNAAKVHGYVAKAIAALNLNKGSVDGNLKTAKTAHAGYQTLISNDTISAKKTAVGGISQIITGVYASKNKVLIKGFEKAAKAAGIKLNDFRYTATSKLAKDMKSSSSIDDFYNDLKSVDKCFQKAKATAKKLKADGKKQLAAGKKQYAAGLASYKAAPAQLEDGRQQLADGKKQLAQYEDGEQQVRDGLATLMSTEPNGGLESILDRRGGDDEFDDANGHLDIKEGLDAVDVGRGYQADSGELITKEITNRAVGTAAGLGAAVLACIAALLSLIKKYKGAAVTAVLAAIAGVAGAVVGNGAGSEFSNIAGSTVGSLPWIAAGVVAAVACVFAIVNFTAKAE